MPMKLIALAPAVALLAFAPIVTGANLVAGCSVHFDTGSAALPPGWRNRSTGIAPLWHGVADAGPDGHSGAAVLSDRGGQRYEAFLSGPAFQAPTGGTVLTLHQRRAYSWANTAAVLEISIDGRAFTDIVDAGGVFIEGAYDGRSFAGNPLGYRRAWMARPGGYDESRLRLPAAANGHSVRLRLHAASAGTGDDLPGWFVAGIECEDATGAGAITQSPASSPDAHDGATP
jgi:hypothetical protein